jgi:hypothetical protein
MKPEFSVITLLLVATLTTALFAPAALPRDRGNGYGQHTSEGGIPWDALSGDEQTTLKDYRRNWTRYSPAEQQKLRRGARRYLDLPPGQREAVRRKQEQYRNMSPRERERLREQYRRQQD